MNIIHVNFADREYRQTETMVRERLEEWGLLVDSMTIPKDAIACALDDAVYFSDQKRRIEILKRLEERLCQESKRKKSSS